MEKNSEFGYHQHPYWMSPNNPSLFEFHSEIGHLNTKPVCEIPHSVEESAFTFPLSGFQHPNANTLHYQNPFPPLFNPATIQNFPAFDFGLKIIPSMVSTPPEKKFLVFEGHIRVSSHSNTSNPPLRQNIDDYEATEEKEDEMHEDTEELNALLSSDDEEKSTGHSPSTVTNNRLHGPVEEEEVDSFSSRPTTKRRRIPDESTALGDDDAESIYIGFDKRCNKRARRDKIHETLRVLRGLIPGTEGKDGVVVIDEAVDYLRSLKVKAKALGLDAP